MEEKEIIKVLRQRLDFIYTSVPIYVWEQMGIESRGGYNKLGELIDKKIQERVAASVAFAEADAKWMRRINGLGSYDNRD